MDYLSDFISRLNLANKQGRLQISVRRSHFIVRILACLEEGHLIRGYSLGSKEVVVFLKYSKGSPVMRQVTRVSKRSRRVYTKDLRGQGFWWKNKFFIVSSHNGLVLKSGLDGGVLNRVGGEVLFMIN